ncbi:MAG: hypothetical protein HY840_03915 [Bacteroidetes bacterium]|nr:hypothetical protein [Bacteroidota bacterium]
MKSILATIILVLPLSIFAQGPNANINPPSQEQQQSSESFLGSNSNKTDKETTECKDCEAVKKALKESRVSFEHHHRKSFSIKKWTTKFLGRMNMKKKMFVHRKKIRTNYEICFNWN